MRIKSLVIIDVDIMKCVDILIRFCFSLLFIFVGKETRPIYDILHRWRVCYLVVSFKIRRKRFIFAICYQERRNDW